MAHFIAARETSSDGIVITAVNADQIMYLSGLTTARSSRDRTTAEPVLRMHFADGRYVSLHGAYEVRKVLRHLGCEGLMPD